jgi:site-specific recombinase XerC
LDKYIEDLEKKYNGWSNRYNTWEMAKTNLESHNYLFFVLGRARADAFGTPHSIRSIWQIVSNSISRGTNALFDNPKWTNPHSFRHIAEKHIRLLEKSDDIESFSNLLGHSREMGDMYAEQIMTDYELSETLVDDWWLNT